jgi:hypothetical protein
VTVDCIKLIYDVTIALVESGMLSCVRYVATESLKLGKTFLAEKGKENLMSLSYDTEGT